MRHAFVQMDWDSVLSTSYSSSDRKHLQIEGEHEQEILDQIGTFLEKQYVKPIRERAKRLKVFFFDENASERIILKSLDQLGYRIVYCSLTIGIEKKPPKRRKAKAEREAG